MDKQRTIARQKKALVLTLIIYFVWLFSSKTLNLYHVQRYIWYPCTPMTRKALQFVFTVTYFVLCFRGEVDEQVWRFLLTGGVALENPHPNPFPHWLSEKSWGEVVRASELPNMKGWFKGATDICTLLTAQYCFVNLRNLYSLV